MYEVSAYQELDIPQRILLGPGPSMIHPRVMRAMATPITGYLDPAFLEVMDGIQELLRYVFGTKNPLTLAIPGTGSAAMEAAVVNFTEPGNPILVCINGYFGQRLADMARRYGGDVRVIERRWGEAFTLDEIDQALERCSANVVAIVHAETSTGVRQQLEGISNIVHDRGGILIVDTVTSLGGIPVSVDDLGIDVCYSCAQKCLGAPPGLSPITISPRAQEFLQRRLSPVPNWYLDLSLLQRYWGQERVYHHTASVTLNYALYEALRIVAEEGLENRWKRHEANTRLLWEKLQSIGLEMHVAMADRLLTLTSVRVPEGVEDGDIRQRLLLDYNIEVGGGFGELKGKIWRIGLMGYSSNAVNVLLLASALEEIVSQ